MCRVPSRHFSQSSLTSSRLPYWGSHPTKSKFEDGALIQTPYFTAGNRLAEAMVEPALQQGSCPHLSLESPAPDNQAP